MDSPSNGCITQQDTTATASGMEPAVNQGIGHAATSVTTQPQRSLTTGSVGGQSIGGTSRPLHAVDGGGVTVGANKTIRYMQATADTADGAALAAGWINHSGRTIKAGEFCLAVEA